MLLKRDFTAVRTVGSTLRDQVFRISYLVTEATAPARLGLAVSRRVGGAVQRNRIKRVVREVFRHHQDLFPPGLLVVAIPQDGHRARDYHVVEKSLRGLANRIAQRLSGMAR